MTAVAEAPVNGQPQPRVRPAQKSNGQQAPQLRTRKPTGKPSWPLVLVEGPEKSGKSWMAAEFTASDRIGQAYWLDWNEGAADEYAAIPGADYEVIEHGGTYNDIVGQVDAVYNVAEEAAENGEAPVLLVIDSMTAEWDALKAWANWKARQSRSARKILAENPGAEIKIPMNVWNDANDRHTMLMRKLMRFPGIVVITARGKEVAAMDDNGRPVEGVKDYKVEGHKNLAFDASAWVRLGRESAPTVVGARSVHAGIRPGIDKARVDPGLTLEKLVFDVLLKGADPKGQKRNIPVPQDTQEAPAEPSLPVEDMEAELEAAGDDTERLARLGRNARAAGAPEELMGRITAAYNASMGEAA